MTTTAPIVNLNDINLQGVNEPLQFTQAEGLQKTYAHYLLFKEDSPTLLKVLEILVPKEKIELFKAIFTELNKKHVNAGLKQFAPNIAFIWNESEYGIKKTQYDEMKTYGKPILSKISFSPYKMEKEMYENQPQIDFIHEAVIQYFPEKGADTNETNNGIIQKARDNLQISLKQGYIGTKKEYIDQLETPLQNITDIVIKKEIFDKLPNVLHLEAVAELHRHAFLSADKKDVLEVIANAHTNSDVSEPIPNAKALYVKKDGDKYIVSTIQMNQEFEKYIKKENGCWTKTKTKTTKGGKQKSKKARSK